MVSQFLVGTPYEMFASGLKRDYMQGQKRFELESEDDFTHETEGP